MSVKVEGMWPGAVTLQRGWSLAESRPWNDSVACAHLRMLRGGSAFLQDCVNKFLVGLLCTIDLVSAHAA